MSKSHRHIGNEAEDLACEFLIQKGWEILDRNYYAGHSEIDIIAKDGEITAFIEVKMRSNARFGNPIEHVSEAKVEHVFKAAEAWALEHGLQDSPMRFDVIGILKKKNQVPEINHVMDAYR